MYTQCVFINVCGCMYKPQSCTSSVWPAKSFVSAKSSPALSGRPRRPRGESDRAVPAKRDGVVGVG